MYEIFGEAMEFIEEHPQFVSSIVAGILGGTYIYWPSDPFDIREPKANQIIVDN